MSNPASKSINIKTQEGLDLLKLKAKFYGHYADNLKVLELIERIEYLEANRLEYAYEVANAGFNESLKHFGW